jgi:hypothetical protein
MMYQTKVGYGVWSEKVAGARFRLTKSNFGTPYLQREEIVSHPLPGCSFGPSVREIPLDSRLAAEWIHIYVLVPTE